MMLHSRTNRSHQKAQNHLPENTEETDELTEETLIEENLETILPVENPETDGCKGRIAFAHIIISQTKFPSGALEQPDHYPPLPVSTFRQFPPVVQKKSHPLST